MTKIVVSDKALREMVGEALNGTGWSNEEAGDVNVNPVVDPSCAVTDPVNPDFTPQTKTEFGIAVGQLVKNLPDTEMPELYDTVKKTLDQRTEKEEQEAMDKKALQGGSDEAIDKVKAEARVRKAIKQVLADINPRFKGTVTEAPDPADAAADEDLDEPEAKHKRTKAYKATALGGMADVGGASFEEIAKSLGFSVAGAKQAVDKSIEKLKFLWNLDEDDREILVLSAMGDYVKMLAKTGELTAPDIQLMHDHPGIVRELDGFREYLHNYVRRARKEDQTVSTFGEAAAVHNTQDTKLVYTILEQLKEEGPISMSRVGKNTFRNNYYVAVMTMLQNGWAKDVKGMLTLTTAGLDAIDEHKWDTEGNKGSKGSTFGEGRIEPGSQIKMKSISGEHPKAASPGDKKHPPSGHVTHAKTLVDKDVDIDWGKFNEEDEMDEASDKWKAERPQGCKCPDARRTNKHCPIHGVATEGELTEAAYLTEAVNDAVYQDKKGPYLVYEGLEVRPKDPNRTQYKAGQRVTVKNSGMRKGIMVAQMPNGELWRSEARKPSKRLKG